jgi:hypothetical protein
MEGVALFWGFTVGLFFPWSATLLAQLSMKMPAALGAILSILIQLVVILGALFYFAFVLHLGNFWDKYSITGFVLGLLLHIRLEVLKPPAPPPADSERRTRRRFDGARWRRME